MSLVLVAQQVIVPTQNGFVEGSSQPGVLTCVFEDDGVTGYFYALDRSKGGNPIVDAVQIYQYTEGNPENSEFELNIFWTETDDMCALDFDGHLYAVFDFKDQVGYNRTGFPKPSDNGKWTRSADIDKAVELLRSR